MASQSKVITKLIVMMGFINASMHLAKDVLENLFSGVDLKMNC